MSSFSSGADIDLKRMEEEIRKEIEEKKKQFFTQDELEDLQNLELKIPVNPDRIRTFFLRELDFEEVDPEHRPKLSEHLRGNYNIDLNTFLVSEGTRFSGFLNKLRGYLRPFFRLHGNIDALIHKQATFNREQVQFDSEILQFLHGGLDRTLGKLFHYVRTLHTLANYLVSELTKLHLQHHQLKAQVEALAYDLDQLRKRERLLEKMAVLKEDTR